jgi:photosystem II stability/assembly factor-like uncharacterized protein
VEARLIRKLLSAQTAFSFALASLLFALSFSAGGFAQSYETQRSGTAESLRGVASLPDGSGWASGTHGTYLFTANRGLSWTARQVPGAEALDFRDVQAFAPNTAFLLSAGPGDQSRIYKTTDSGLSWNLEFTNTNPKGFFDCFAFWDQDNGIALGDPVADSSGQLKFELIITNDGGQNWIPLSSPPAAMDGEGAFAASGSCLVVQGHRNVWFATGGKIARIFHSTNRGQTWEIFDTPLIHGPESAGIFSIFFRDAKHGAIAGGDYQHSTQSGPNLAFTSNGGRSWKLAKIAPQSYFSSLVFTRDGGILVAGSSVAEYAKKPGDLHWSKIWNLNLNALGVDPRGGVLGVGPKGAVLHFTLK